MTNLLNNTLIPLKFIYNAIKKIRRNIIFSCDLSFSKKVNIICSGQCGEPILCVKEKSIERIFFPKIYDLAEESYIDFHSPKIEVRKFTNSLIYPGSDFIITKDGAIWDKFFKPQWPKIIPLDNALLKIKDNSIFIKNTKPIKIVDIGFSLCGVHCAIWSHFLVQYLPKLYLLKQIQVIVNSEITVLLPTYMDPQIKEIVNTYLNQFQHIKIEELNQNEIVRCNVLYYFDKISDISDHSNFIHPFDIIIPRLAMDLIKNNLVDYYLNKLNLNSNTAMTPFRKLYIGRTGYRNITNHEEIEKFFEYEGFEVIYPHLYALEEKIRLFNEATVIVGTLSSGFSNFIFSKPGTKVLQFVNLQRTFDGYGNTFAQYCGVDLMLVTGTDQNESIHSSFYIPLEKIKSAYLELLS